MIADDDLAGVEGRREQALEIFVRIDLPLVRDDGRAEPQNRGGVVGGRVVIGDGAADGAAMTHLRIADAFGELGKRRDGAAHLSAGCYLGVGRCGTDDERAALAPDALQRRDTAEIDQCRRFGEPLLERWDQRLAARNDGSVRARESARRIGDGGWAHIAETVHAVSFPYFVIASGRVRGSVQPPHPFPSPARGEGHCASPRRKRQFRRPFAPCGRRTG